MDLVLLGIFQQQVLLQCEFILAAAQEANATLKQSNVRGTFYALQNLLNATANVSKALWGQGGKLAVQRKELRESIGIADDSPLRDVDVRNHFEHFDERLDRWWEEFPQHKYVDLNIGPLSRMFGGSAAPVAGEIFRHFDAQTGALTFWGEEFKIQEIITEVQRILPKLKEEANKPHSAK